MTTYMLCRHKVIDYDRWKPVFDANAPALHQAGLNVEFHWRGIDDPNEVFILFAVDDVDRARAFVTSPRPNAVRQQSPLFNEPVIYFIQDDFQ